MSSVVLYVGLHYNLFEIDRHHFLGNENRYLTTIVTGKTFIIKVMNYSIYRVSLTQSQDLLWVPADCDL